MTIVERVGKRAKIKTLGITRMVVKVLKVELQD